MLDIDGELADGAHALITTPGATRFYRSAGERGAAAVRGALAGDARLEWLPLETHLPTRGCTGREPGALRARAGRRDDRLGRARARPAGVRRAFDRGRFMQQIELPGVWLERGCIDAGDARLLDSPLGWAGQRVLATLWFAAGAPIATARREALLDAARERCAPTRCASPRRRDLARTTGWWCCACWRRASSRRCGCWRQCGHAGARGVGARGLHAARLAHVMRQESQSAAPCARAQRLLSRCFLCVGRHRRKRAPICWLSRGRVVVGRACPELDPTAWPCCQESMLVHRASRTCERRYRTRAGGSFLAGDGIATDDGSLSPDGRIDVLHAQLRCCADVTMSACWRMRLA